MKKKGLFIVLFCICITFIYSSKVVSGGGCPTDRPIYGSDYRYYEETPIILQGDVNFHSEDRTYFVIKEVIKNSTKQEIKLDSIKVKISGRKNQYRYLKRRFERKRRYKQFAVIFIDSLRKEIDYERRNLREISETKFENYKYFESDDFSNIKKIYEIIEDKNLEKLKHNRHLKGIFKTELFEKSKIMDPFLLAFKYLDSKIFLELYENWDLLGDEPKNLLQMAIRSNNRELTYYLLNNCENEKELYKGLDFLIRDFFNITNCFRDEITTIKRLNSTSEPKNGRYSYRNIEFDLRKNIEFFHESILKINEKKQLDFDNREFDENILLAIITSKEFSKQPKNVSNLIKILYENSKTSEILSWNKYEEWQNCFINIHNALEEKDTAKIEDNIQKLLKKFKYVELNPSSFFSMSKIRKLKNIEIKPKLKIEFLSYFFKEDYSKIMGRYLRIFNNDDMLYLLDKIDNVEIIMRNEMTFFQFYLDTFSFHARKEKFRDHNSVEENEKNIFNKMMFNTILEYNPSLKHVDEKGNQALYFAAKIPDPYYSLKLIEKGADVSHQNKKERTALIKAGQRGNIEVMEMLFENGADINFQDKRKNCLLHRCLFTLDAEVVKFLIKKGVNIHHVNKFGLTPLMFAVKDNRGARNDFERIHILLKNGAIPKGTDIDGNTFRDLVHQNFKKEELIDIFEKYGYDFR